MEGCWPAALDRRLRADDVRRSRRRVGRVVDLQVALDRVFEGLSYLLRREPLGRNAFDVVEPEPRTSLDDDDPELDGAIVVHCLECGCHRSVVDGEAHLDRNYSTKIRHRMRNTGTNDLE